jgi:hypothetical protein
METDLSIRLHAYASTAEPRPPVETHLYADAIASSRAASAAASAGIICSHTRVLRGDPAPDGVGLPGMLPEQDELDFLCAEKPAAHPADEGDTAGAPNETSPPSRRLPLHAGNDTLTLLALGADGIPAIKGRDA